MSGQIPKILSIGKATRDVFLIDDEFDPHKEGKKLYTHLPLGEKIDIEEVGFTTGGNATNVAVTFARQGLHSEYVWTLGNDPASEAVLRDLDAEGVLTHHVVQKDAYQAGYSTILIATNGERTILNYSGKSTGPKGEDLDLSPISSADWVYPTALAHGGLELLRKIVDEADKHDVKVMLNPAGSELTDPAKLKGLLESVEVLCMNKEEAQLLVHGETADELVRHLAHYVPVAIVSDGPRGVVATDGKTLIKAGMYRDVKVVDRTGAGDAFASGFLSQWAKGKSLKDSIVFASANSTSVVTKVGAKAGILPEGVNLHDMPLTERPLA
jgi:ribokinase